ncbi:hypothetical protein B0J18DRAFT_474080 [Chaetomium sp. MPI-SDFR-AT-0129]|nr:hypothetical protein B0J18DRAFT_474080 [Chaetomium sp. MPI-SDFR-AT-0129]
MPTLPTHAQCSDYDPAWKTLSFDVIAGAYAALDFTTCSGCRAQFHALVRYAADKVIEKNKRNAKEKPGSYVTEVTTSDDGTIQISTIANPDFPVKLSDAIMIRRYFDPQAMETTLERFYSVLPQTGNDTLGLAQTQIWRALYGTYELSDAVRGRPIAAFVENYLHHLSNVELHREHSPPLVDKHAPLAPICQNTDYGCFGEEIDQRFPFGMSFEERTWHALQIALSHMDNDVRELLESAVGQIERRALRRNEGEFSWIEKLNMLDNNKDFIRSLQQLQETDDYIKLQSEMEEDNAAWRMSGGPEKANELAERGEVATIKEVERLFSKFKQCWRTSPH